MLQKNKTRICSIVYKSLIGQLLRQSKKNIL